MDELTCCELILLDLLSGPNYGLVNSEYKHMEK